MPRLILRLKVHDLAQSFVLRSYTMHELRIQNVFIALFLRQKLTTIVFCVRARSNKLTKTFNKELCRIS